MKTSLWTPYISDHTINAICWTLIHSLWIGMGIAILSGLVIATTRKASAALRYRLLCSLLMLFVASAGVTFYLEMRTAVSGGAAASNITAGFVNHVSTFAVTTNAPQHLNLFEACIAFLNRYTNVIFIAWLLFFVLKSLKMVGGLLYIQRIRNYKTQEVAEEFKHKIELFSRQIGIGRTVRLVQSELIKVPVAVGWLKPMILLPVGIIFQLSTEQLESILWHELAHIRRRDYLVNILQGLVETVFFFNPGLLWLSALIRAEREACCDDMVLSRMDRKANYLEALLAFGYEGSSKATLAMGIGSGNQLRDRLKRMISQENRRLNMAEKVVLGAGLILLSAFTGMPKATNDVVKHMVSVITKKTGTDAAEKPLPVRLITQHQPVHKPVITDTTHKKTDTTRFTSILFKSDDADLYNSDIQAKDTKGNKYHFVIAKGKLTSMELNDRKIKEDELAANQPIVDNIRHQLDEKRHAKPEDIAAFINKYKKDHAENGDEPETMKQLKELTDKKHLEQDKGYADGKTDGWNRKLKREAMKVQRQLDSTQYKYDLDRARGVIADLVKEGVVKNAADVKWFGLSDMELQVNGQRQTEALHQKLKAKYGVHENFGLYYGPVKMTGTGVFIGDDADRARRHAFQKERQKAQQFGMVEPQFSPKPKGGWASEDDSGIKMGPIVNDVTSDLVGENILKNKSDLTSFYLTNASLTVNGVKQSEAIHEKLKRKYLTGPGYQMKPKLMNDPNFGLHFDARSGHRGIGIADGSNGPK